MDHPQNTCSSPCLSPIKFMLRVLADNATFANSTGGFDGREVFHHGMILNFLQVFEVQMFKPFMPHLADLIPMSQKGGGICIGYKLGELIGLSRVIHYTYCNEFSGCNL